MVKVKEDFGCMWGGQYMSFKGGEEIDHPALVAYLQKTAPQVLDDGPAELAPAEPAPESARRRKTKGEE